MSEKKPHVHAAVIKAWADGATIQYQDQCTPDWTDCKVQPCWNIHCKYRIKPEPKKLYIQTIRSHDGNNYDINSRSREDVEHRVHVHVTQYMYTRVGSMIEVTLHEDA